MLNYIFVYWDYPRSPSVSVNGKNIPTDWTDWTVSIESILTKYLNDQGVTQDKLVSIHYAGLKLVAYYYD